MAAKERAIHLDYFDPAVGKVPNPGMGVQGYVYSDHMRFGYTWAEIQPSVPHEMTPLDRKSLERMAASPHCDNLYYRCEWRDIQQEKGCEYSCRMRNPERQGLKDLKRLEMA